jgi:hypothetical protein
MPETMDMTAKKQGCENWRVRKIVAWGGREEGEKEPGM